MTKKQEKQETIIHLSFWIIFIVMNFYFEWLSDKNLFNLWSILQFFAFYLLQIIIFYLNYLWICKKTIPKKKWGWFVLGQIFLLFLFPALRHLFEEVIIFHITGRHNYNEKLLLTAYYLYDNSYYALRTILLSLVFYFIKTVWNTNKVMNELLLQKKQAELQNLKNQLSPHFLFNTLNSFYADLMDIHPKTAEDILKLSDMLRYITYENENNKVSLKNEILFIQHYIALFSRRFDNQVAVDFQVNSDNDSAQIPPLLLIHFVENAFKHGIISDTEKPISIKLKTTKTQLNFTVQNYYVKGESYDEKGIGYKNVRQRLEILYSANYVLDISQKQDFYQINLQIPLTR